MNMSCDPFYVITVPHAVGKDGADPAEHWQDFIALPAAKVISEALGGDVNVYVADVNRSVRDYNRIGTRMSKWRRNLRKIVDNTPRCVILDIHSFPDGDDVYRDAEIAVVTPLDRIEQHEADFADFMLRKGVRVHIITDEVSDIVAEHREKGKTPFMIEFNEGLSKQRLDEIAHLIADYFHGNWRLYAN